MRLRSSLLSASAVLLLCAALFAQDRKSSSLIAQLPQPPNPNVPDTKSPDSESASPDATIPTQPSEPGKSSDPGDPPSIFGHSKPDWLWVSGQANIIWQGHFAFHAPYSGPNSLKPRGELTNSRVFTLYTGVQLVKGTEILFDVESAQGRGISDALGLAGFTDLDVVRNPSLGAAPYIARVMLHQVIPLSSKQVESERGPFSLATELPERRLEINAGKISMVDWFDTNSVANSSHDQFLNWTIDNNGGYDYSADTRGYTYGLRLEYQDRDWAVRFAESLMPKIANGIDLEWNLRKARAENIEFELRRSALPRRTAAFRFLTYINHANMGSYQEAIAAFLTGKDPVPDVTAHRRQGRIKYGFGISADQEVSDNMRIFGRWGWNEGNNESFAYTEVNETILLGADYKGIPWGRKFDRVGLAFVSNGISKAHQEYLKLGGQGFLLGDGNLNYGRENIAEVYYNLHLWRGIFSSPDLQYIVNPGYNRDRGPVVVPALRMHVDF